MAYLGVLPEAPSFGTQLARGLGAGVGAGLSQSADLAQRLALEKQKMGSLAQQTKHLEKIKSLETGLGTIERMRELIPFAGGFTSAPLTKLQSLIPGEVQSKRAELESLGRSLIPLVAAGVPIRNQREFDEYRKIITDPSASPSKLEGALNGIQNILERSVDSSEEISKPSRKQASNNEKPFFDSSKMEHKRVRDALMKKFKNNREKVADELMKHFREE